ncbi:MAG: hypothetical protein NC079_05500 [Clostridium sp.]|nr:hypothetical protein [Acetatifactor muris]MCM1563048.1 hypothetical protein [Clostridium sp.]
MLLTLGFSCGFCAVFLKGANLLPSSDCSSVFEIAIWMSEGNMQAVVPKGSYLSLYPFQTGMIFIFEKMIRIFHTTDPLFFQGVNVLYVALAITSGFGIVRLLCGRIEIILPYLLFAGSYFPMLLNTGRIYGDVPSMALMMFATWMFLLFERNGERRIRILYGILGLAGTVLASTYRRNTLIYVLAVTLAFGLRLIRRFRWTDMLLAVCVLVLSAYSTGITQKYYEYYADNTMGEGMPAMASLAMGVQDSGGIPGGNNGFHVSAFLDCDYDVEATVAVSREAWLGSWREFADHPDILLDFFYRKLLLQWGNPTCGCFWQLASLFQEPQSDFALSVLYSQYGSRHDRLVSYMNWWQSALYGMFCVAFVRIVRDRVRDGERISPLSFIPLITFIGGFLFSMIWEAGPRYVMAYPFLLLPFMLSNLRKPGSVQNGKVDGGGQEG